jgi:hypothetical protein
MAATEWLTPGSALPYEAVILSHPPYKAVILSGGSAASVYEAVLREGSPGDRIPVIGM